MALPKDTEAARRLRVWMAHHRITGKELAARLGCGVVAVSEWRNAQAKPGRTLAVKLEQESNGEIPVPLWEAEPEKEATCQSP